MSAWLLGVVLAATVAAAAGLLGARLLRRAGAMTRHAVLLGALVLVLLAPAAPWATASLGLGWRAPSTTAPTVAPRNEASAALRAPVQTASVAEPASAGSPSGVTVTPANTAAPVPEPASSWPSLIAWCVALGAGYRMLRLLGGMRTVRRLLVAMRPAAEPEVLGACRRAARALGLRRAPRIGWVDSLPAPLSTTLGGATIALPAGQRGHLAADELRAVIWHEMSHLAHRHHFVGLLLEIALVPFWWHPLVHWLAAALRAVQEDVADDRVLAVGTDPRGYARFLLRLAEALPAARVLPGTTGLLPRGSAFARRIEGLLAGEREPMTRMNGASVALAGLFLSCATAATISALPAQEPGAARNDGARYLPLQKGAMWTWEVKRPGQEPIRHRLEVIKEVEAGKLGTCWELRSTYHERDGWEYWAARRDGVFQLDNAYLGGMRGVSARGTPTRVLACPLGVETEWRWEEVMSVQTMAGAAPIPREELLVRYVAKIEAMAESVEVPAGRFDAVRVVTTAEHRDWTTVTSSWWVPGVGLVRQEALRDGRLAQQKELVAHEPGKPRTTVTPEQALTRWLATAERKAAVRWLRDEVLGTWFESRFALVDKDIVRVYGEQVTAFDPRSVEHWQRLLKDEKAPLLGDNGDQTAMEIAQACVTLECRRLLAGEDDSGVELGMVTGRVSTRPGSDDYESSCVLAIAREGKDAEVHSAAMRFDNGVLKKLAIDDPETVKGDGPGQVKVESHRGGRRR